MAIGTKPWQPRFAIGVLYGTFESITQTTAFRVKRRELTRGAGVAKSKVDWYRELAADRVAGGQMSTAEKYRRHAADCLRLALSVGAPGDRALLMEMAAMWLRLVERAERMTKEAML